MKPVTTLITEKNAKKMDRIEPTNARAQKKPLSRQTPSTTCSAHSPSLRVAATIAVTRSPPMQRAMPEKKIIWKFSIANENKSDLRQSSQEIVISEKKRGIWSSQSTSWSIVATRRRPTRIFTNSRRRISTEAITMCTRAVIRSARFNELKKSAALVAQLQEEQKLAEQVVGDLPLAVRWKLVLSAAATGPQEGLLEKQMKAGMETRAEPAWAMASTMRSSWVTLGTFAWSYLNLLILDSQQLAERARERAFKTEGGILLLIKAMEPITKDKPIASQNQVTSFSTQAGTYPHIPESDALDEFKYLFENPPAPSHQTRLKPSWLSQDDLRSDQAESGSCYEETPQSQFFKQQQQQQMTQLSQSSDEQIPVNKRTIYSGIKNIEPQTEADARLIQRAEIRLRGMDLRHERPLPDPSVLAREFANVRERTLNGMLLKNMFDIVLDSSLQRKNNRKQCSTNSEYFGVVTQNNRFSANIHVKLIKKQVYLGSFASPIEAAFQYDIGHVLLHGLKAKTNFSYSKEAVLEMLATQYLFDTIHKKYYC